MRVSPARLRAPDTRTLSDTCPIAADAGAAPFKMHHYRTSEIDTLGTGIVPPTAWDAGAEVLITTRTLTSADNGRVFYLNLAGGFTVTLPAPYFGAQFTFIVMTAPTTAYIIANHLGSSGDQIIGYPVAALGSDETANGNAAGDQINFVANTALPGDSVELFSNGVSWFARCIGKATGWCTITG